MRCAIFSVTQQGLQLALRVRSLLEDGADIYGKSTDSPGSPPASPEIRYFHRLKPCIDENFSRYDALILIMAAGIAVRMIAPHLNSKLLDPAVIVMDEKALHVISLLSGHIGGANLLTRHLASGLGSDAVITTATDVEERLAPDVVAMHLALRPWPKEQIKKLNRAVLDGLPVDYYMDEALPHRTFYEARLAALGIQAACIPIQRLPKTGFRVLLTTAAPAEEDHLLCLAPRRLIAGIGCRRGTNCTEILASLSTACARIGRSLEDLSLLASTEVKADEQGLLEAAAELGLEIQFLAHDRLQHTIEQYRLTESDFVKEHIGVGNVCEAAALSCVKQGTLALPKTKFPGTTVALIWEK